MVDSEAGERIVVELEATEVDDVVDQPAAFLLCSSDSRSLSPRDVRLLSALLDRAAARLDQVPGERLPEEGA